MESGAEDAGLSRRPVLASSWDAACGALAQSLRLTRADLGARELDWDELLAPPAAGRELVVLRTSPSSPDEKPCFLYLRCDPKAGEEIASVGVLSSARNMEVYVGEEYCGTSRGKSVCGDLGGRWVTGHPQVLSPSPVTSLSFAATHRLHISGPKYQKYNRK